MLDYMYRLIRKSLSSDLYRMIKHSPFGRAKQVEHLDHYISIFENYKNVAGDNFKEKNVLEIGAGNQIITALHFLSAGAEKVILVDPKLELTRELIRSSINQFKSLSPQFSIDEEELRDMLFVFKDMSFIPDEFNSSIDFVFSHLVLEHFDDLTSFFSNTSRLIDNEGLSYNVVDTSDHMYHIFDKYGLTRWILKRRALFHLRYSDGTFKKINDEKCYMNRLLLPVYLELAEKYNFKSKVLNKSKYKKTKIHKDVLSKFRSRNPDELFITSFQVLFHRQDAVGS